MAISKKAALRIGLIAGGGLAGLAQGYAGGIPGQRKGAAKEGLAVGLSVGSLAAFSPSIYRFGRRAIKRESRPVVRQAVNRTKVVFRRIRGRIVPIKVKT